jgi:hypothetical protein
MASKVQISRTSLAILIGDAARYQKTRTFFKDLIADTIETAVRDLPNGIDWGEIDRSNAMKEGQKALSQQ